MFVLHLFSGFRRQGDLQWCLEQALVVTPTRLHVISIDIAHDPTWGDLTDDATVAVWLDLLRSGRVAAIVAGPPCESWSAARHIPAPQSRRPPRPLRSLEHLWGLGHVNGRERQQLDIGNQLLRTTIRFLHIAWIYGVPAIMEHPAQCTWREGVPSSWQLPSLRRLAAQPGVKAHLVHQCAFGGRAKKPTTLLAVHMQAMQRWLDAKRGGGLCLGDHPHRSLQGLDADGLWVSAQAKTYPQGLCVFLAATILEEVRTRFPCIRSETPLRFNVNPLLHAPSFDWSDSQDCVLCRRLGIDAVEDEWDIPWGLRRYFAPMDPYVASGITMDCMIHQRRD